MNKRKKELKSKMGVFIQQYARKKQKRQEPNDRTYDRDVERRIKKLKPMEFDELLYESDE